MGHDRGMLIACTRAVSPGLADCELTHLPRQPIDVDAAAREHHSYEEILRQLGAEVRRLPDAPELPDAVFVEDTAIVLDELAIIARPGAATRRAETASTEIVLANHRPVARIVAPGTLDGGDVLVIGRRVYVGRSSRTNDAAIAQLTGILQPFGYEVVAVGFTGCLHLKSCVTQVAEDLVLLNPLSVDIDVFKGCRPIEVDPSEPLAGNALMLGGSVLHPQDFHRTRARLVAAGLRVTPVAITELAKAEAGVTCCSLLLRTG
jgi:dimethylargininase